MVRVSGFGSKSAWVLAAASFVVLGGCPSSTRQAKSQPAAAPRPKDASAEVQAEFDKAFESFADRKWAASAKAFEAFANGNPSSALVPEALYRRGVALNRLEKYEAAREVLRVFMEKYPTSPYARQAAVELGLAESKLGNKQDAAQILAPVIDELTPEERKDVEPALAEAIKAGSAATEAIRRQSQVVSGATSPASKDAATAELVRLVDTQASYADLVKLYEELESTEPAYGLVAAKMARIHYHLGDFVRAKEAAARAQGKVPAASQGRLSELLERIQLRDRVSPSKVGVVIPQSGRFKNFGAAVEDGVKFGIDGKDRIELVFRDSEGDAAKAVQAVEDLAREGVIAIIGPVGVAEAAPAAARAQELGVPMIQLSRAEGVTAIGDFVFRNSLTNSQQGRALARYAAEVLGVKGAAVLAPDLQSGEEMSYAFWDVFEKLGGEIRGYETYAHDQTTFAAPIRKLVARNNIADRAEFQAEAKRIADSEATAFKRRKLMEKLAAAQQPIVDFDVLLIPDIHRTVTLIAPALAVEDVITNGCDEKELERIRKTTKRDDLRTVTLLGGAGWNSQDLVSRGGRYVTCSVFVDGFYAASTRDATKAFVADFEAQFQRKPGLLEAQAYDTARIVRDVLRGRPTTRTEFRDRLAVLRKFPGVTGDTTFGPSREADKPLFFLNVSKLGIVEMPEVVLSPDGVAVPAARSLN